MSRFAFLSFVTAALAVIQAGLAAAALESGKYLVFRVGGPNTMTAANNPRGGRVTMLDDLEDEKGMWNITKNNNETYTFQNVGTGLYLSFIGAVAMQGTPIITSTSPRQFRVKDFSFNEDMYTIAPVKKDNLYFTVAPDLTISFQPQPARPNNWLFVPLK